MTDMNYSNLWLVRADGSGHRPLTTGKFTDNSPRWSPDGSRIAYMSNRDGMPQIYMHWMASGQTAAITNLTDPATSLSWSPDGSRLAFYKLVPEAPLTVGELPAPPAGAEWAAPAKYTDKLVFRFRRDRGHAVRLLAPLHRPPGRRHSASVDERGEELHGRVLRCARRWTGVDPVLGCDPAFGQPEGRLELEWQDSEIYEVSVDDGSVRTLTDRRGRTPLPRLQPDGSRIAYLGYDDRYQGYQLTRLYVMDRDGVGFAGGQQLTGQVRLSDHVGPRWRRHLRPLRRRGEHEARALPAGRNPQGPRRRRGQRVHGLRGASASRTRCPPTAPSPTPSASRTVPGDVAVGAAGSAPTLVTGVNDDLFAGKDPGAVEEIWWESSKDGRPVQGWIMKPPDFDPDRKYPLVLEIHGGPFANYGDRFDVEKQLLASTVSWSSMRIRGEAPVTARTSATSSTTPTRETTSTTSIQEWTPSSTRDTSTKTTSS